MNWPPDLGMPWFWLATVARVAAFITAVLFARRERTFTPVAWLLGGSLLADGVALTLTLLFLAPARAIGAVPYTGSARAAFHVTQALFVGWSAGITALAIHSFAKRRPWAVALVYLVVVAAIAAAYPELRRERLQSAYLAMTMVSIAVSSGAIAVWWRSKPTTPPGPAQITAALFVLFEFGALIGPYAAGLIDVNWPIANGLHMGLDVGLAILMVRWLRRR
jgi:hypothetical protein